MFLLLFYANVRVCEIVSVAKTAHSSVARSLLRRIIISKTICIIINRGKKTRANSYTYLYYTFIIIHYNIMHATYNIMMRAVDVLSRLINNIQSRR